LELRVDGASRPVPAAGNLGALLVALRDELSGAGRAITVVALDGTELLPEGEPAAAVRALDEFGRVDVTTADAGEWGRHGLGEASSALGRLADEVRSVSELLRAGDRETAAVRFHNIVATYGRLVRAIVHAATLAGGGAPAGFQQEIGRVLINMKSITVMLGADEAGAAADMAEHELASGMEKLGGLLRKMSRLRPGI
jgi:hypothetical protein